LQSRINKLTELFSLSISAGEDYRFKLIYEQDWFGLVIFNLKTLEKSVFLNGDEAGSYIEITDKNIEEAKRFIKKCTNQN